MGVLLRGGPEGPCLYNHKAHTVHVDPADWDVRVRIGPLRWSAEVRRRNSPPVPVRDRWDGVRRNVFGSLKRLYRVAGYIRELHLEPSHLLTLTIPHYAWQALPREEAPNMYRKARNEFLRRMGIYLKRQGLPWGGFRWDEFQRNGTPHVHAYLDLGARLPQDQWESLAREWIPRTWRQVLLWAGFPLKDGEVPRTQLKWIPDSGVGYAIAYAVAGRPGKEKRHQRRFPFPGKWGRSWDTFGEWRRRVSGARYDDRKGKVIVRDIPLRYVPELVAAFHRDAFHFPYYFIRDWLPLREFARWVKGEDLPPNTYFVPYAGGWLYPRR